MQIQLAPDTSSTRIAPIRLIKQEPWRQVPTPLARISTCGLLSIEVLTEVVSQDPPQGRYQVITPQTLRGRGPLPALTLLKFLVSRPQRYGSKDWLTEQLQGELEAGAGTRLDNPASYLRGLLCGLRDLEHPEALRLLLVTHLRTGRSSGPGYQLAPYPLIWLDTEALFFHVEHGALMERMGDPELALPFWQQVYALASRGVYLPDELFSDWAQEMRGKVAGALRQSVHALYRLLLTRYGEAGEEEALHLLRHYWLSHPTDEDALRPLMEVLGKRERYQEAEEYYQHLLQALERDEADRSPDQRTQDLREYLRTKQLSRAGRPSRNMPLPESRHPISVQILSR